MFIGGNVGTNVKQTKDVSVKASTSLTKAKKVNENPLDAGMLKMASEGYSAEEIGEAYGVPAAQAAQRIRDILQSRDWLTEIEQQKLNIMNLRKIQGRIMERVDKSFWDVDDMKEFIRATELLDKMLEKSSRITDDQLSVVSTAQARALVKLMTLAWDKAIARLQEEYPNVEISVIVDTFHDGLREGVREIEGA